MTYFTPLPSVSISDFEQVKFCWEYKNETYEKHLHRWRKRKAKDKTIKAVTDDKKYMKGISYEQEKELDAYENTGLYYNQNLPKIHCDLFDDEYCDKNGVSLGAGKECIVTNETFKLFFVDIN